MFYIKLVLNSSTNAYSLDDIRDGVCNRQYSDDIFHVNIDIMMCEHVEDNDGEVIGFFQGYILKGYVLDSIEYVFNALDDIDADSREIYSLINKYKKTIHKKVDLETLIMDNQRIYIGNKFYLDPAYRNKGIGAMVINLLENKFLELTGHDVTLALHIAVPYEYDKDSPEKPLAQDSLIKFYKRCGYSQVSLRKDKEFMMKCFKQETSDI